MGRVIKPLLWAVVPAGAIFCIYAMFGNPRLVFADSEASDSKSARVTVEGGWEKGGSAPFLYEMEEDKEVFHTKSPSYCLSSSGWPEGTGMLVKEMSAKIFRGKRVRMSAYVKTEQVTEWAGLWMRIDSMNINAPLGFDNMHQRPIQGTTGWQKYEIVLDVPEGAQNIIFGMMLSGPGKAWLDDVRIDVVGRNVPVTGKAE